jgi:hypothetical protein
MNVHHVLLVGKGCVQHCVNTVLLGLLAARHPVHFYKLNRAAGLTSHAVLSGQVKVIARSAARSSARSACQLSL